MMVEKKTTQAFKYFVEKIENNKVLSFEQKERLLRKRKVRLLRRQR